MIRVALKYWWVFIFFVSLHAFSFAQSRTVSGIVSSLEESRVLEGVTVYVKGGKLISGSQPDGVFYLDVSPADSFLVFEYAGYRTENVRIKKGEREYNVLLSKTGEKSTKKPFPLGSWRGNFITRDGAEIPFNFDIDEQGGGTRAWFLNAEERFEAGSVRREQDSLFIEVDQFDNELAFHIKGEKATGVLRKQDKSGVPLPVTAAWGTTERFLYQNKAARNISGTYDVKFKEGDDGETKTVGLFTQSDNKLKATFMRTTGDSRFLEGVVSGDTLFLSSFIGSSPSYYKAAINADGSLTGFSGGIRGQQAFTGIKNNTAALPDPYTLTFLNPGYTQFDFSFPDLNGKLISPKDEQFKNKVLIITITGTWCPNCIDEAAFLAPWYKENKQRGVEAIAIHYERSTDQQFLHKVIDRFRSRHGVEYIEVIGGVADKKRVAESLPALNSFLAFPTILFIDKKGNVAKIYTGFTGPATGSYFEDFKKEFNKEIDRLLQ